MTADFFYQVDDPYGPLALPFLGALARRHGLALRIHLVPPPDAAAAPEIDRLDDYARRDAAHLAKVLGLAPVGQGRPNPDQIGRAQSIAAAAISGGNAVDALAAITRACLSATPDAALDHVASDVGTLDAVSTAALLTEGAATRKRLGHYLGATTHVEGEFYWGVDRLHYLETRLRQQGGDHGPRICPVLDVGTIAAQPAPVRVPRIDFYLSFRSPYTLVAAERIDTLASAYGAEICLKFVLPMVMRGLPVPGAKRMYITLDTKREALRHDIGFGNIHDPVGLGVERGLAVLHQAIKLGTGLDFARSFLRGAFADGIDMTNDAGLLAVAARAGVGADTVNAGLADPSWRDVAEANRADLFALGLWGVPSFQVDDHPGWWGQDRLWCVEDDLRDTLGLPAIDRKPA